MLLLAAAVILKLVREQHSELSIREAGRTQSGKKLVAAFGELQKNLNSLEQRTAAAERKLAGHGAAAGKEFYQMPLRCCSTPGIRRSALPTCSICRWRKFEMVRELQRMIAAEDLGEAAHETPADNNTGGKNSKRKFRPTSRQISDQPDCADGRRCGKSRRGMDPTQAMNGTAA